MTKLDHARAGRVTRAERQEHYRFRRTADAGLVDIRRQVTRAIILGNARYAGMA